MTYFNKIIDIDNVSVRDEIFTTHFSCNLDKCKGACCTLESEYGAPLLDNEIPKMEATLPVVLPYLPEYSKRIINKYNFWEDKDGHLMTRSVNNHDCVFVYYDNNIAKCAIEKAYFEGKVEFRKPISCHLFPIRVSNFGGEILKYEEFSGCKDALVEGKQKKITVAEFCKESLGRAYGSEWYNKLMKLLDKK